MSKRTFPIAIFTTFGLLQADRPQNTHSCFLPLCTHVLSSSCSQGGTSSQHSDTTWKAVKQELLEVFLCAITTWSIFQLKQVFDLNHILWNWKARSDQNLATLLVSITIAETISLWFQALKSLFRKYSGFKNCNRKCLCLCAFIGNTFPAGWNLRPQVLGFIFLFQTVTYFINGHSYGMKPKGSLTHVKISR